MTARIRNHAELEAYAAEIVDRVEHSKPLEDDLVELKRDWPRTRDVKLTGAAP